MTLTLNLLVWNISLLASVDTRKMKRDLGVLESKKELIKRGIIRHTCCEGENGKKEGNLSREMEERAGQRKKRKSRINNHKNV